MQPMSFMQNHERRNHMIPNDITGREKFIKALKREPVTGLVPHFELVFYLTMEALGKVHPLHRDFYQWMQMSINERELQIQDIAACHIAVAEKYRHSAIFVQSRLEDFDSVRRLLEIIREKSGNEYFLMMHGDSTASIPDGGHMMEFTVQMYEEPEKIIDNTKRITDEFLTFASKLSGTGLLDGFALCSDYCTNVNSFFPLPLFEELIVPPLKEIISEYRRMGYYSIKHSDGNIMPILKMMIDCEPDALHSLDPQGGVDLAEVKRIAGERVALIGNVNCGLLHTGTEDEVRDDVLRALHQGMPGGGFIFSTSNCIYTGLPLERYELMHNLWLEHGDYGDYGDYGDKHN